MLVTFKAFIEAQQKAGLKKSDLGTTPAQIYTQYLDYCFSISDLVVCDLKDDTAAYSVLKDEGLFLHLVIQLNILYQYHRDQLAKCSDDESLPTVEENDKNITEFTKRVNAVTHAWLKNCDAKIYEHVLSAINAKNARRQYIYMGIAATVFVVSGMLAGLAVGPILPDAFLASIIITILSFPMAMLISDEKRTQLDTIHPALIKGYWQTQTVYDYHGGGFSGGYSVPRSTRQYIAPHDAYIDDADKAEETFQFKHSAVLQFSNAIQGQQANPKKPILAPSVKDFADTLYRNIDEKVGSLQKPLEDLSKEMISDRYSRKYQTPTSDPKKFDAQALSLDNGPATVILKQRIM